MRRIVLALIASLAACASPVFQPGATATQEADRIKGTAGADRLRGLAGNDRLSGGGGDDHIEGGPGDDVLFGGSGRDDLEGGSGADHFVFTPETLGTVPDRIIDFRPGEGDVLVLNGFEPSFEANRIQIHGTTLVVRPSAFEVWQPIADLGQLGMSIETLAKTRPIRFELKVDF